MFNYHLQHLLTSEVKIDLNVLRAIVEFITPKNEESNLVTIIQRLGCLSHNTQVVQKRLKPRNLNFTINNKLPFFGITLVTKLMPTYV